MNAPAEPEPGPPGSPEAAPPEPPIFPRPPTGPRPPPLPPRRAQPGEVPEARRVRSEGPDTYVPVLPPRQPRWWALLLGLGLTGLGLWLVVDVTADLESAFEAAKADGDVEPDGNRYRVRRFRSPLDWDDDADEPKYDVHGAEMGESDIEAVRFLAWFVLLTGVAIAALLGTRRPGRLRFCDVCARDVVVVPVRGWRCERCNTRI